MKFRLYSSIAVGAAALLYSSAHAQITNPAPYCAAEFQNNYNMVQNMTFAGQAVNFGAEGTWIDSDHYRYYNTTTLPAVVKGTQVTVAIHFYSPDDAEPRYFALWIDLNHNNAFEAGELLMQNSTTTHALLPINTDPETTVTAQVTIPATAASGATRMRLMRGTNPSDPYGPYSAAFSLVSCVDEEDFAYGCTFDFNVTISGATGIADEELERSITLGPNPTTGLLNVNTARAAGVLQGINILSSDGRLVSTASGLTQHGELDMTGLSSGIYQLLLRFDGDRTAHFTVVKQ